MKIRKLFWVFTPLLLGVLIYLLYRSRNLFYYQILHATQVKPYLSLLRESAKGYRHILSTWMVYSFPDGLWLFSFGAALLLERIYFFSHLFVFTCIFFLMIGIEYLQKFYGGHGHWLGTFDFHDIEAYTIAYCAVVLLAMLYKRFQPVKKQYSLKQELFYNLLYIIIFSILGILPSLL